MCPSLNSINEVLDFIKESNPFYCRPTIEHKYVKIGYGHKLSKRSILEDIEWTEEQADHQLKLDLNKINKELVKLGLEHINPALYKLSVHFIYNHGIQAFINCYLNKYIKNKNYDGIVDIFERALKEFEDTPDYKRRLSDLKQLRIYLEHIEGSDGY